MNSYLTVIGVHSTMHLVHPNYCQITSTCVCTMYGLAHVRTQCTYGVCIRCVHAYICDVYMCCFFKSVIGG